MPLVKPVFNPKYAAEVAGALNEWLPCPYTRQALLDWVEASLAVWDLNRQIHPDISPELERSMFHEQYRDWVEAKSDIPQTTL